MRNCPSLELSLVFFDTIHDSTLQRHGRIFAIKYPRNLLECVAAYIRVKEINRGSDGDEQHNEKDIYIVLPSNRSQRNRVDEDVKEYRNLGGEVYERNTPGSHRVLPYHMNPGAG